MPRNLPKKRTVSTLSFGSSPSCLIASAAISVSTFPRPAPTASNSGAIASRSSVSYSFGGSTSTAVPVTGSIGGSGATKSSALAVASASALGGMCGAAASATSGDTTAVRFTSSEVSRRSTAPSGRSSRIFLMTSVM